MSDLREAAQQFVSDYENGDLGDLKHYARAIRAALAQPNEDYERGFVDGMSEQAKRSVDRAVNALAQEGQEPVAKYSDIVSDGGMDPRNKFDHPPRREWQSLSEDELTALGVIHSRYQEESLETGGWFDFARAVEAALKEKNA